jgi:pyrophosphatase PpaX
MIKAIIFDSDGTLLNSFELIVAAYTHVAQQHGLRPPTAAEVRAQLGKSLPDIYRSFYPDADIDKLLQTNSAFIAEHAGESAAFEGLQDLLEDLKELGLQLAILTGGNHKIAAMLEHHGIAEYFASVVHCERVEKPKPDPEGFLLAAKECGVEPGEAIMVGDTVQDLMTGKNAGAAATIAITHGIGTPEDLAACNPEYTVGSLEELAALLAKIHAGKALQ